jgi:Homeodomain-like domain
MTYKLDVNQPIPDEVGIDIAQRSAMRQFPGVLSDDDLQHVALTYLEYIRKGKEWRLACKSAILSVRRALTARNKIVATTADTTYVDIEQHPDSGGILSTESQTSSWSHGDMEQVSSTQPSHDALGVVRRINMPSDVVRCWSEDWSDNEIAEHFGVSRMTAWRWRKKASKQLRDFGRDFSL